MEDGLKGHLLLCQSKLDGYETKIIIGFAGGDYSLQTLKTSLRNTYRSEILPLSSMVTTEMNRYQGLRRHARHFNNGEKSSTFGRTSDQKPPFTTPSSVPIQTTM